MKLLQAVLNLTAKKQSLSDDNVLVTLGKIDDFGVLHLCQEYPMTSILLDVYNRELAKYTSDYSLVMVRAFKGGLSIELRDKAGRVDCCLRLNDWVETSIVVGEPIKFNPDECRADIYQQGELVVALDIPKEQANALCKALTVKSEMYDFDWQYSGGRVCIRQLKREIKTGDSHE